jgi:hypothetical protein
MAFSIFGGKKKDARKKVNAKTISYSALRQYRAPIESRCGQNWHGQNHGGSFGATFRFSCDQ